MHHRCAYRVLVRRTNTILRSAFCESMELCVWHRSVNYATGAIGKPCNCSLFQHCILSTFCHDFLFWCVIYFFCSFWFHTLMSFQVIIVSWAFSFGRGSVSVGFLILLYFVFPVFHFLFICSIFDLHVPQVSFPTSIFPSFSALNLSPSLPPPLPPIYSFTRASLWLSHWNRLLKAGAFDILAIIPLTPRNSLLVQMFARLVAGCVA